MSDNELALVAMPRICKKAGAERLSEPAIRKLATILENIGVLLSEEALEYARYTGRKIVKDRDIKKAAKTILGIQKKFDSHDRSLPKTKEQN